jgi:hypothetical protein
MLKRKRRGTLAQELGKTIGGVASFAGGFAFCKAINLAQHVDPSTVGQAHVYRSAYFGGSGDLFAPFPPEQIATLRWIGLALVVGGTLLRLASYGRITAPKEEDQ